MLMSVEKESLNEAKNEDIINQTDESFDEIFNLKELPLLEILILFWR